ncbi:hypothetical protein Skr01_10220 [Sphaerisporangium krabiense]|uniref:Uncharacterized protein n=1 Tax=Sphaerisporangium krabiense TaxID=763782 RepID=A0A7W9DUB0_9ACTN|nr:hypothetical protein [Sphaerisporangium krabiense]MBB5631523.1 hypothetical protein [Sphaerisporangium krabiense]GII60937.1 hypothetical protein Skr01_10220 [Sphaerisporangium krabiense]
MNVGTSAKGIAICGVAVVALSACSFRADQVSTGTASADARNGARPPLAVLDDPPPTRRIPYLADNPDIAAASGMDLAGARVAATDAAGSDLIALTRHGDKEVCVIATDPVVLRTGAGSCASVTAFATKGVFAVLLAKDFREVVGLVPDGVATVVAGDAHGHHTTLPVHKNAIRVPLDHVTTLTFSISGRQVVQDFTQAPTKI